MTAPDHTLAPFKNHLHQWGIHTCSKCYQRSGIKPRQVHLSIDPRFHLSQPEITIESSIPLT